MTLSDRGTQHHNVMDEEGQWRVNDGKCSTCLFQPKRMIREVVDDARQRGAYVKCHETYPNTGLTPAPGVQEALCRGFWDAHKDENPGLAMIAREGFYREVPRPPDDPDRRYHKLVRQDSTGFHFRRVTEPGGNPDMIKYEVHQTLGGQRELLDSGDDMEDEEFPYIQDAACSVLGSTIEGGVTIEDPSTTLDVTVTRDNGEQCSIRAVLNYVYDDTAAADAT